MRRKQKEEAESQGRRVVFIPIQQEPCMAWHGMLTHSHAACLQGSLDSEPQDASGHASINSWLALATATSGSAGVRGVFVSAERVCMRRESIPSMVSLILRIMLVFRCAGVHEWGPLPATRPTDWACRDLRSEGRSSTRRAAREELRPDASPSTRHARQN